jgi:hypothetical protein
MGKRMLAGVRRRPRFAMTVAMVLAVGGLLAVIPVTVGAAKSSPTTAAAANPHKPKAVTLVAPNGTPINLVNGSLGSVALPAGVPVHLQGNFAAGPAGPTTSNLLTGLPRAAQIAISSITVTCIYCGAGGTNVGRFDQVVFFANDASDCTGATSVTFADIETNDSQASVDFTYPTPRTLPLGFTPMGPWCIGVTVSSSGNNPPVFVSIDGTQN